jgi:hypothetical protein
MEIREKEVPAVKHSSSHRTNIGPTHRPAAGSPFITPAGRHTRNPARPRPTPPSVLPHMTLSEAELPTALRGPIIHARDLPGGLCLGTLQRSGTLIMLDPNAGYLVARTETLYGRASIARRLVPDTAIASGSTALWVWHNADGKMPLPSQTSVVSSSHYRTTAFGRRIIVHDRAISPSEIQQLGGLRITAPLRTACDTLCMAPAEFEKHVGLSVFLEFVKSYSIELEECRASILANTRWPGYSHGLKLLDALVTLGTLSS